MNTERIGVVFCVESVRRKKSETSDDHFKGIDGDE